MCGQKRPNNLNENESGLGVAINIAPSGLTFFVASSNTFHGSKRCSILCQNVMTS